MSTFFNPIASMTSLLDCHQRKGACLLPRLVLGDTTYHYLGAFYTRSSISLSKRTSIVGIFFQELPMAAPRGMQNREVAAPKSAGLKDEITSICNMHANCHMQERYRSKWNVIQHDNVFERILSIILINARRHKDLKAAGEK